MPGTSPSCSELIAAVIKREGGYVNDPKDPGGETKYGISKRAYPNVDIAGLTEDGARDIYLRDYWLAPGLDKLPLTHVEPVFDMGVNAGVFAAVKLAQRAVRVTADGRIGPRTVAAISAAPARDFRLAFALERLLFYLSTILARPTSVKYARGWFRRALEVL
jgi:lysozyme family protein